MPNYIIIAILAGFLGALTYNTVETMLFKYRKTIRNVFVAFWKWIWSIKPAPITQKVQLGDTEHTVVSISDNPMEDYFDYLDEEEEDKDRIRDDMKYNPQNYESFQSR
ncbi:MAG: hypothetical protein KAS32_20350 [Candidatus Peribacteraceae bacterium]|nr:hypothetical protein [Candidatus Peribacteraceae bacterium]